MAWINEAEPKADQTNGFKPLFAKVQDLAESTTSEDQKLINKTHCKGDLNQQADEEIEIQTLDPLLGKEMLYHPAAYC